MTCQDLKDLAAREAWPTGSELQAAWRHYRDCGECQAMIDEAEAELDPLEQFEAMELANQFCEIVAAYEDDPEAV